MLWGLLVRLEWSKRAGIAQCGILPTRCPVGRPGSDLLQPLPLRPHQQPRSAQHGGLEDDKGLLELQRRLFVFPFAGNGPGAAASDVVPEVRAGCSSLCLMGLVDPSAGQEGGAAGGLVGGWVI